MTDDKSFSPFSLRLYSQPGVEDSCLALQNNASLDVNMLLFCCWYGAFHGIADQALWDSLLRETEPWNKQFVVPLRQSRQWIKHHSHHINSDEVFELREEIKALELKAELLQQQTMQHIVSKLAQQQASASSKQRDSIYQSIEANFQDYLLMVTGASDAALNTHFTILKQATESLIFNLGIL